MWREIGVIKKEVGLGWVGLDGVVQIYWRMWQHNTTRFSTKPKAPLSKASIIYIPNSQIWK